MNFKEELFYQLLKEKDKANFEKWIYKSDSTIFEQTIGVQNYLDIIGEGFSDMALTKMKAFVLNNLSEDLQNEFKAFIKENQKVIKATCIKTKCLDYDCKKIREWDLTIGKDYYVLGIGIDLTKKCHQISFQIFDPSYSTTTPYFIPAELFEIKDRTIPDNYIVTLKDGNMSIEPFEFADKNYEPIVFSFWEDYFDDQEKALTVFKSTIERLDINLGFE